MHTIMCGISQEIHHQRLNDGVMLDVYWWWGIMYIQSRKQAKAIRGSMQELLMPDSTSDLIFQTTFPRNQKLYFMHLSSAAMLNLLLEEKALGKH